MIETRGDTVDSAKALYETLKRRRAKLGLEHADTLFSMNELGSTLVDDELTKWQQESSKRGGVSDDWLARAGLQMLKSSRYKAAELLLREMLSIREKRDAAHWRTFNAKSLLGGALLGQKKYVEAEPLLLSGYEGMQQREAAIDAQNKIRIPDALERLVLLYTEWHAAEPDKGYDVKAADWQAK